MDELGELKARFQSAPDQTLALEALSASEQAKRPLGVVLEWVLALERWAQLDKSVKEAAARNVALLLADDGFRYDGLHHYELGGVGQTSAQFLRRDHRYALIPAGQVQLGFDRNALKPSTAMVERIAAAYGRSLDAAHEQFIAMTQDIQPLRTARLSPFLIDMGAQSWPGWDFFAVKPDTDPSDLASLVSAFRVDGLRLPTVDEWELACSGGNRSLFRWGSEHPFNQTPAECQPWTLHCEPNSFGIRFPYDSFRTEFCTPYNLKGGDAGIRSHAGCDILSWFALANAYDATRVVEEVAGLGIDECEPLVRLVRPLSWPD